MNSRNLEIYIFNNIPRLLLSSASLKSVIQPKAIWNLALDFLIISSDLPNPRWFATQQQMSVGSLGQMDLKLA